MTRHTHGPNKRRGVRRQIIKEWQEQMHQATAYLARKFGFTRAEVEKIVKGGVDDLHRH